MADKPEGERFHVLIFSYIGDISEHFPPFFSFFFLLSQAEMVPSSLIHYAAQSCSLLIVQVDSIDWSSPLFRFCHTGSRLASLYLGHLGTREFLCRRLLLVVSQEMGGSPPPKRRFAPVETANVNEAEDAAVPPKTNAAFDFWIRMFKAFCEEVRKTATLSTCSPQ